MRAFVAYPLTPVDPALSSSVFADRNHHAELALARLSGVSGLVPSVDWLLYSAIRKEALLTSQIEGKQATLTDLFDEEAGYKVSNTDDVEEVTNYLRAFRGVQAQLRDPKGQPISVWLLLDGARGAGKQPGELRGTQNQIGGTRPCNALFVPPPERVAELLADMQRFTHAHFETIHPFLDSNGQI